MARLYANENFPVDVVIHLRTLGHDVVTTHDVGKSNQGIEDDSVVRYAIESNRCLLTRTHRELIVFFVAAMMAVITLGCHCWSSSVDYPPADNAFVGQTREQLIATLGQPDNRWPGHHGNPPLDYAKRHDPCETLTYDRVERNSLCFGLSEKRAVDLFCVQVAGQEDSVLKFKF